LTGGSAFDADAIADRLLRDICVTTVLDLGSPSQLTEALRARGISVARMERPDAHSLRAHASREYDLILSVGAIDRVGDIDHLPDDAEALVTEICARTPDVILAPGIGLFGPAAGTGTGPRPRALRSPWARLFAAHGFFLDIDYDVTFVSPLAMRFRRSPGDRGLTRTADESRPVEEHLTGRGPRPPVEEKDELILNLNAQLLSIRNSVTWKTATRLRSLIHRWLRADSERLPLYWGLRRTLEVLLEEGVVSVLHRVRHKMRLGLTGHGFRVRVRRADATYDRETQYGLWLQLNASSRTDLEEMRRASQTLSYQPLISIVMPVHDTDEVLLRRAIDSVREQAYQNWQLCLANDGSQKPHVGAVLDEYARLDVRIRVAHLPGNTGIAAASNHALQIASGEFVGLLDHDDELTPDALFEVAKRLAAQRHLDLVYSDEDKLDSGNRRVDPFFKPDWSPDLLLSMNYITHFAVFRRALLQELGGFRHGYDGSQDYDLLLRVTERTAGIAHIPKVLYHWRKTAGSAAVSPHTKPHAHEAGRRAIADALRRRRCEGSIESLDPGMYRIRYRLQGTPLVSIIIPTRDAWLLLRQCLDSLEAKTDYAAYEVIILDNESRDPAALKYLDSIVAKHRVYRWPGSFNFSTINNFGANKARGDYLLFLNNDVQIIRPDWLLAMLEQAQRSEVGAVGAKLLYPDGRIQHAGLVLSAKRPPAHAFRLQRPDDPGYHRFADVIRNCSAVTGACLMVRRRVFEDIGGFDQRFRFAYNDVDLCLRLRRNGFVIVYTPFAVLYHHESATRGTLHPPEEEILYRQIWGETIGRGDPYYNVNLSQTREDWSLELGREVISRSG
jgi:GT2 family glycosyltransferase